MKAIVFPGQGSQFVGMGKDLFDNFPETKIIFEEVDDILNQKLSHLIFNGPEEELMLTENAQPAIMLIGMVIINILKKRNFKVQDFADIAAGHSLGEYTALAAIEGLTLAETARLLKIRGKAMQESFPKNKGAMAAIIGLNFNEVEEALSEKKYKHVCQIANDNAPGQVVISGEGESVEQVIESLKSKGAKKAVKLPVSAPFHCDLMEPAKEIMRSELKNTEFGDLLIPIIQNVGLEPTLDREALKENLVKQVTETVRWRETINKFVENGVTDVIEIGAGNVLTNLSKRNAPNLQRFTLNSKESLETFIKDIESV